MAYITIKPMSRLDKNLVYKDKKYPIDFVLMQQYSNYLFNHQKDLINVENIIIPEINIELNDNIINSFISCCYGHQIQFSSSNVLALNQLAIYFEVPGLIKLTNDYIKNNKQDLLLQSNLQIYINNQPI